MVFLVLFYEKCRKIVKNQIKYKKLTKITKKFTKMAKVLVNTIRIFADFIRILFNLKQFSSIFRRIIEKSLKNQIKHFLNSKNYEKIP